MLGVYSVDYNTYNEILTIEWEKSFWRWFFRKPAKVEHFRFVDGWWYENETFKKAKDQSFLYLQYNYLQHMSEEVKNEAELF